MKKFFASLAVLFLLAGCKAEITTPVKMADREVKIIKGTVSLTECKVWNQAYNIYKCSIVVKVVEHPELFGKIQGTYQFSDLRVKPSPVLVDDSVVLLQTPDENVKIFQISNKVVE